MICLTCFQEWGTTTTSLLPRPSEHGTGRGAFYDLLLDYLSVPVNLSFLLRTAAPTLSTTSDRLAALLWEVVASNRQAVSHLVSRFSMRS